MEAKKLISYYKDCYQADTRTLVINNFFSSRIENRFFVEGNDELLNGNMERYPIPDRYADELKSNLTLYKREKVLYCFAFFVIGRQEEALRKESKVCAPLFLYPAEIGEDEFGSYVTIDHRKRQININFLNSIKKEGVDDLHEAISAINPVMEEADTIGPLIKVLDNKVEDVVSDELLMYPMLHGGSKVKRLMQPKQLDQIDGFQVIPSLAFGVFKRSTATQGIIAELQELTKSTNYSQVLSYMMGLSPSGKVDRLSEGWTPATLSEAQKQIVESVNNHLCTLVIGPPGTGKSFTIASLALDFLSKGKKVLIASKTDQAVDVIFKKIEQDLGVKGISLRAGKSGYKRELKEHLNYLLTLTRRMPGNQYEGLDTIEKVIRILDGDIDSYGTSFQQQVINELRWGRFLALYSEKGNLLKKLKARYIKWRVSLQRPHWVTTQQFLESHNQRVLKTKEYIELSFMRTVHHALYGYRRMFRDFQKSLTARRSSRKDELFDSISIPTLLNTFPIWLVNMADIHEVFPLEEEAFDLVIIDEATQCDIASSIPILQRGKRAVIVGDPKQLRHASFLSRSYQQSLRNKHGIGTNVDEYILDYRNTSLLDLVNDRIESQNQVIFLNEHYRSKPDIIAYSNKTFYHGELDIMTHEPEKDQQSHILIQKVNGIRNSKGINEQEADCIIKEINKIIQEEGELDDALPQSIGVLSPFRDQVDYLGSRILKEIADHHINRRKILCGTAYSFQGEERDIMLLSMTVDDQSHHSAVLHMNKPDVFNVSITRARSLQIIYTSFTKQFDPGKNVSAYLSDVENFKPSEYGSENARDEFLNEVITFIKKSNYQFWINYSIAGLHIDIVLKAEGNFFGINLIGYPGVFVDALTLEDYKILMRAGVRVFPLPFTYWKFDQEQCIKELLEFVKSNSII